MEHLIVQYYESSEVFYENLDDNENFECVYEGESQETNGYTIRFTKYIKTQKNKINWYCSIYLQEGKNKCNSPKINENDIYNIIFDLIEYTSYNKTEIIKLLTNKNRINEKYIIEELNAPAGYIKSDDKLNHWLLTHCRFGLK